VKQSMIEWCLRQECIIKPWIRVANGEDIYGQEETRKCRVQNGAYLRHTYQNPSGVLDQVEAHAKMFCVGEKIPTRSVVTIDGEEYIVIKCYVAHGLNGPDHLEVYLQ